MSRTATQSIRSLGWIFVLSLSWLMAACYSYESVVSLDDAPLENDLRVTLTDGRVLELRSWRTDSLGTLHGTYYPSRDVSRVAQIDPGDIVSLESREFNQGLTITLSVLFAIPLALITYFAITWD